RARVILLQERRITRIHPEETRDPRHQQNGNRPPLPCSHALDWNCSPKVCGKCGHTSPLNHTNDCATVCALRGWGNSPKPLRGPQMAPTPCLILIFCLSAQIIPHYSLNRTKQWVLVSSDPFESRSTTH